jgi:hypothetical protein
MARYLWFPVVLATMAIGVFWLMPRAPADFRPERLFEGWGGVLQRADSEGPPRPNPANGSQSLRDRSESWSLRWSAAADARAQDAESADLFLVVTRDHHLDRAIRRYEVEIAERRASGGFEALDLAGQAPVDAWAMDRLRGGERIAFALRDRNTVLIGQMRLGPGRGIASDTDAAARLRELAQRLRSLTRP